MSVGYGVECAECADVRMGRGVNFCEVWPPWRPGGTPAHPRGLDQWVALEGLLDHAALDPRAAAVDEAHVAASRVVGGLYVLIDHRSDIAWREGVEIERVFDRDAVAHGAV